MSDHYDDSSAWVVLDDSYLLGIPSIDDQHKHLIFLCNKFRAELMKCESGEIKEWYAALQDALKETSEYIETHFSTEEKLMRASQYDEYDYHKFCHKSFVDTVRESAFEFAEYLRDWILTHILYEDKRLADHVKVFYIQRKM